MKRVNRVPPDVPSFRVRIASEACSAQNACANFAKKGKGRTASAPACIDSAGPQGSGHMGGLLHRLALAISRDLAKLANVPISKEETPHVASATA